MQQTAHRAHYALKRSASKIKTCPAKKPRQKKSTTSNGNSNGQIFVSSDGESSDSSRNSSDDEEWTSLIAKPSLVDKKYPQSYSQQVEIKDLLDKHQLETTPFYHKIEDDVKLALAEYAGKPYSAWTSEYLALALNLKTSNPPKDSQQTLFLSQNKPPVILVLCGEDEAIKESALAYAGEMARALTSSLLNYCHCEFILLACVVSKDTLSADTLREKIEEKRKQTSKIYYRRQHLSRSEYLQLKKAVTTVSRVSPVRHHLADSCDKSQKQDKETRSQELVILDEDWYNLVLYFINKVMQGNQRFTVPHPSKDGASKDTVALKVKVAAKEACRRLGVKATCTESPGYLEINIEETTGQH